MVRVDERLKASGLDARLILQVHDELIVESSRTDAAAAREILISEMENAVKMRVALKVGVAEGANWYDSH
jgi:DNA polymerase-1